MKLLALVSLTVLLGLPLAVPRAKNSPFPPHARLVSGINASLDHQTQPESKFAVAILVDNSGSLRSQFNVVLDLAKAIVKQTHQRGSISVFAFKPPPVPRDKLTVVSVIAWSQDRDLLERYLDELFVVGGQTTLKDAIETMATQLNTKVDQNKDVIAGKVIFLVTDGEERTSQTSEEALIKTLKMSGIKVYAIGLVKELSRGKDKAIKFLEKIAKETNGRAIFPQSKDVDVEAAVSELFPT